LGGNLKPTPQSAELFYISIVGKSLKLLPSRSRFFLKFFTAHALREFKCFCLWLQSLRIGIQLSVSYFCTIPFFPRLIPTHHSKLFG
jgi:hypothetical protein